MIHARCLPLPADRDVMSCHPLFFIIYTVNQHVQRIPSSKYTLFAVAVLLVQAIARAPKTSPARHRTQEPPHTLLPMNLLTYYTSRVMRCCTPAARRVFYVVGWFLPQEKVHGVQEKVRAENERPAVALVSDPTARRTTSAPHGLERARLVCIKRALLQYFVVLTRVAWA